MLGRYKDGDAIEDFLITFEQLVKVNGSPAEHWVMLLARRLEGKAREALARHESLKVPPQVKGMATNILTSRKENGSILR